MKFSYNWIQSFLNKKLPRPDKLSRLITMKLFEVESIEKKGDDWIIDIDILPNRAGDCFSHSGIAREVSAITNSKFREPEVKIVESKKIKTKNIVSVEKPNYDDCHRYLARAIVGVEIKASPRWMKERLEACGLQSINNIVDATNYVMLETGQPLHAMDADNISSPIIVRRAKDREEVTIIDGKKFTLNKDVLVVSDTEKLLGIAGIKGGKNSQISGSTKNIIIESANFNRKIIRRGSTLLKIRTDASIRFEYGLDNNLARASIDRVASLIREVAGGEITAGLIDLYKNKNQPKIVSLNLDQLSSVLGLSVDLREIRKILTLLDFKIKKSPKEKLLIEIPTKRLDISESIDIIEEVGRIIGYENIPSKLPKLELLSPKIDENYLLEEKIKNLFVSSGLSEVYNHTFISENQVTSFDYAKNDLIEVEKPVTIDQKYLRPSLVPHLIKNIKENEKLFSSVSIFEAGNIFKKTKRQIKEVKHLAGAIGTDSFYQLKEVINYTLEEMGIKNIRYVNLSSNNIYEKFISIRSNKIEIGIIGVISSGFLRQEKIKSKIIIFELGLNKIKKISSIVTKYKPIIRFPKISRDLSVIVPLDTKYSDILDEINGYKIKLLNKIEFVDVYKGGKLSKNSKSITLRLTFGTKRTLTSEEVNLLHKKIVTCLTKNKNWEISLLSAD